MSSVSRIIRIITSCLTPYAGDARPYRELHAGSPLDLAELLAAAAVSDYGIPTPELWAWQRHDVDDLATKS